MKKQLLFWFASVLLLVGCNDASQISKDLLKHSVTLNNENLSTGRSAEMLLVMDKSWPIAIQDSISALLKKPQVGLPQPEPMFNLYQIDPSLFSGEFTKRTNIVHLDVNANYGKTEFTMEDNPWSKPQVYVHIKAKSAEECITCIIEHRDEILQNLFANDIAKLQAVYESKPNVELQTYVQKKFGISMTIPQEYEIAREADDFLWLAYRTVKNDRFIMIYTSPNKKLTREAMMIKRNYTTKRYIEGETKDVYPQIVEKDDLPLYQPVTIWSKEGAQLRGLWETANDYMGGPFYQFSFINTNGECVTIDGFVYAPKEPKVVYLRQVEAIAKSVK